MELLNFMKTAFRLNKEKVLEDILGYLNHKFPAIKTDYINENFVISGEDEQQQLECYETIKEMMTWNTDS